MDIGIIFTQMVSLYKILWNMSFTFFGISMTWGGVVTFGLVCVISIAILNLFRG